jgi:hypothetical protein
MTKYSTSVSICEEEFAEFSKQMTCGFGKSDSTFIRQMLCGIAKSETVILSEIARNSIEHVDIKKSVERLSRKLCSFNGKQFEQNRINAVKELLPEHKLYIVDDSEIVKPCAKKMEGLGLVADGSDNHKIKSGYWLNEIAVIDKNRQPQSVSSVLYTTQEKEFESANRITQAAIQKVIKTTGNGVFVFDRGFDDVKLHRFLIKNKQGYIIRATAKRNVVCCDSELNIKEFAKLLKGKYSFSIRFQQGIKSDLKASYKTVYLPKMPETPLNFVVVYGFSKDENEPFYLLTNLPIADKESCIKIVGAYLTRWKIEEYFKFKKQAYAFENVRVRTLLALKGLNTFLTAVITFLAILCHSRLRQKLEIIAQPIKEKACFLLYRILAGLNVLLKTAQLSVAKKQKKAKKLQTKQRDFFHYLRYIKWRTI